MIPAIETVSALTSDARVRFLVEEGDFGDVAPELKARGFEGKVGQTALVRGEEGIELLVGVGKDPLSASVARKIGASISRGGWRLPSIGVHLDSDFDAATSQGLAEGIVLGAYQYNEYKTTSKPCELAKVEVVGGVVERLLRGARTAQATMFARDLINEPAATMTPIKLADLARSVAETHGLDVTIWDEDQIEAEGMGGLLAVARGSVQPPRFIQLRYNPPGATKTVAIVGKGITFDSGGLSLKPSDGMLTMKTDMSGAAAVLATMSALKDLNVEVNVLGIMCCAENMPSGSATKLGDVMKIRNGKTVEMANTDAEGRLVLADGLSIAVENEVDAIIDLATLTGAAVVCLGREISCVLSNHDELHDATREAGERAGEPSWRLPLPTEYRKHIDSEIADLKNIGKGGEAGTITAALFLKEFVSDKPWVHLDIAGPARSEGDDGIFTKGATGVGVRTLIELLSQPIPVS